MSSGSAGEGGPLRSGGTDSGKDWLPPPGVTLRRFTADDSLTQLTALVHRAYQRLADLGLRAVGSWQDDVITRKRLAKGECWLAEKDGRMVGTVLFLPTTSTRGCPWYDRPDVAGLQQLAVEPELQGTGIGLLLLRHAEKRARETGAAWMALDTPEPATHLIEYYSRQGYKIVETAQWEVTNYRSVVMVRALRDSG